MAQRKFHERGDGNPRVKRENARGLMGGGGLGDSTKTECTEEGRVCRRGGNIFSPWVISGQKKGERKKPSTSGTIRRKKPQMRRVRNER